MSSISLKIKRQIIAKPDHWDAIWRGFVTIGGGWSDQRWRFLRWLAVSFHAASPAVQHNITLAAISRGQLHLAAGAARRRLILAPEEQLGSALMLKVLIYVGANQFRYFTAQPALASRDDVRTVEGASSMRAMDFFDKINSPRLDA